MSVQKFRIGLSTCLPEKKINKKAQMGTKKKNFVCVPIFTYCYPKNCAAFYLSSSLNKQRSFP